MFAYKKLSLATFLNFKSLFPFPFSPTFTFFAMPVATGQTINAAIHAIANSRQSVHSQMSHRNPNKSLYQSVTQRFTQSSNSYTISTFTSNTSATLGSGSIRWEIDRTADLAGDTFAIFGLPGIGNFFWCDDASNGPAGAVEIVHPDILDHYRLALGAGNEGQVVAETDTLYKFYAHDGASETDAAANFVHGFEGQPYYTPNAGYHAMISSTLQVGNATIDTQLGLRAAAWAEVQNVPGKRLGAMVGGSDLGSIRLNKHLELKRRSMRFQLLFVPLLHTFCLNDVSMLPLPAMQFHKIDICMRTRGVPLLVCNGSSLPNSGKNAAGGTSMVVASVGASVTAPTTFVAPFTAGATLTIDPVQTMMRYGQDTAGNQKQFQGDMIALSNDASWALTDGFTSDLSNASCPVMIGMRTSLLQGAERAAMIAGGYDIPIIVSQAQHEKFTAAVGTTKSVDINSFVNSIEALYIVSQSSNALGANHYNAGRTWDPLVEEYTHFANTAEVLVNGANVFNPIRPEFFNKLMPYISGAAVPTGDSHVLFAPFAVKTNNSTDFVQVYGGEQAASRWSNASAKLTFDDKAFSQATATVFSGAATVASGTKNQFIIVFGDTYNNLHVGQGVGGNVLSNNPPPEAGFLSV